MRTRRAAVSFIRTSQEQSLDVRRAMVKQARGGYSAPEVRGPIIGFMSPTRKPLAHRFLVVFCAIAACTLSLAAKDFVKPTARPAKTYPAHDDHSDEKVAIAADPYDT